MRIGVMIGPERGRYRTKVERLREDARWAEEAGLASVWVPQIPDEFDALTAAALVGAARPADRDRHGRRARPAPPSDRPRPAGAVGPGRVRRAPVPRPRGLAPLDHRRDARAALRATRADTCAPTSTSSTRPLAGPGPVDVENELFRIHNPLDITDLTPTPVLIAALGPLMLRLAGERTDGTILWMADERAIASHVVPQHHAVRPTRPGAAPAVVAGIPVCLCRDDEIDRRRGTDQPDPRRGRGLAELPEAARPRRRPDRRRHPGGRKRVDDSKAPQAFADAGVTDLSVRVVPIGEGVTSSIASSRRTGSSWPPGRR